jgi:hypothetical protein
MNKLQELQYSINRDGKLLEALLNLVVGSPMTVGELADHLKAKNRLEHSLEKNLLALERLEDLESTNSKLEDF